MSSPQSGATGLREDDASQYRVYCNSMVGGWNDSVLWPHHIPHASPRCALGGFSLFKVSIDNVGPHCDNELMSTSSRRDPSTHIIEIHEFAGWESAEPLSDDARQKVERISGAHDFDLAIMRQLDEKLKDLEGDLVPTCRCGWRGLAEPWTAPRLRRSDGGYSYSGHENQIRMERATQKFAASYAAAALRHAADARADGGEVAGWLQARAEHIESVGLYDGEVWP